ncbi:MAG: DNA repair protein RecO [Kiritimatiellaeota bacterium]|nr:DNA repair protein RecO [Kiritimatiellota bacterium]
MPPYHKTEAIALQIRPWSKTSHIVTWLTPGHGCVVTSVKGACRPKSAFLGQYDLFYTCELLFYPRERNGIHAIRECAPLNRRDALREDWRAAAAAAYLADLTARAAPPRQPHPDIFASLAAALDTLASVPAPAACGNVILRYEMRLLHHLGLLPDLTLCPECHAAPAEWHRFSLPAGRILCAHLAAPRPGEAVISLHRAVQERFLALRGEALPRLPGAPPPEKKNDAEAKVSLGLSRFFGIFISFHLDVPATVRRVAMEMMDDTKRTVDASEET